MKSSLQNEGDKIQIKYDDMYLGLKAKGDYKKVLILVEGPDDYRIYKKLLDQDKVILEEHCSIQSGCARVMDMLREINHRPFHVKKKKIKHLAILDADFFRILKRLTTDENLIYTDCHDNEMMALQSVRAIEDLCYVLIGNNPAAVSKAKRIFEDLAILTKFKWYNAEFSLGANFDGMDLQNMKIDQLHDAAYLFKEIQGNSGNCRATLNGLMLYVNSHVVDAENQYEVTNGHDFVTRFGTLLKKCGHQTDEKIIEEKLQEQLTSGKFHSTLMSQRIHEWEKSQNLVGTIIR